MVRNQHVLQGSETSWRDLLKEAWGGIGEVRKTLAPQQSVAAAGSSSPALMDVQPA
jgi:hypothetical protein